MKRPIFLKLMIIFLVSVLLIFISINSLAIESKQKIIVSLGDSYSAGEGIQPYYDQNESMSIKIKSQDWLAHRSENSWPGMLTLPNIDSVMSNRKNVNWYFVATSGAEIRHLKSEFDKDFNKISYSGSYPIDPQLNIFKTLQKNNKKATYVTLTLGGNDLGFTEIIITAYMKSIYLYPNLLSNMLQEKLDNFNKPDGISQQLHNAYHDIQTAAGSQAHIIVAGYPKLLNPEGVSNSSIGFSKWEANLINKAVTIFNEKIKDVVTTCQEENVKIDFISVEKEFEGHEAYASEAYINPVKIISRTQDIKLDISSAASIHPNKKGAMAYARCVQAKIDELEGISARNEFNPQMAVLVYGDNNKLYDNYTITIEGKKHIGLIKKNYSKVINVYEAKTINIELPVGDYTFKVSDKANTKEFFKKDIKIRKKADNGLLTFKTSFGEIIQKDEDEAELLIPLPDGIREFNGHYYYLYKGGIASSYDEALQYCKDKGGYLATLTTKEENDFIKTYLKEQNCIQAYFGFNKERNEDSWKWCTEEEVTFANWSSNYPNLNASRANYALLESIGGTWQNSDFSGHTASKAFICEWGSFVTETEKMMSAELDIVLVLDTSGSMAGTPLQETQKATVKFINTVLEEDASIGIVTYSDNANRLSDFSRKKSALQSTIESLDTYNKTNIEAGLLEAELMLRNSKAKKKIIILMSDGVPNKGKEGNELIEYANKLKNSNILIYTIGFFEELDDKAEAQLLMDKIASDYYHYEVADANDLVFFFEDIAEQTNGQKYIYVKIACPVDVSVKYNKEILNSNVNKLNLRTQFGTLTLEENNEETTENTDNRIKTLRLKEGPEYTIKIVGTDHGTMDYTIGFMDDEGNYSDIRNFERIKITKQTVIETVAKVDSKSILNIDEDGDGKADLKLMAQENGYGEEVKLPIWILYVLIGIGMLITIDIVMIVILKIHKNKRSN